VYQRRVSLSSHCGQHPEGGERVYVCGGALLRCYPVGEGGDLSGSERAVLRVHPPCAGAHHLPEQMLRVGACVDYHAGALEPRGLRLPEAPGRESKEARWDFGDGDRSVSRCIVSERRDIRRAEQFGQVGRVDRRRFDADNNLVGSGLRDLSLLHAQTELTCRRDLRPQLLRGDAHVVRLRSSAHSDSSATVRPRSSSNGLAVLRPRSRALAIRSTACGEFRVWTNAAPVACRWAGSGRKV
jgi:hypothetical protein